MKIDGASRNQDAESIRQQFFQQADQDGDGRITKDELNAMMPQGGSGMQGPSIDDIFARVDTNGDASIDKAENDAFMQSMGGRRAHGRPDPSAIAKSLFAQADADGDGKLTKEELLAALPKHDSSSALDELFKEADEDQD